MAVNSVKQRPRIRSLSGPSQPQLLGLDHHNIALFQALEAHCTTPLCQLYAISTDCYKSGQGSHSAHYPAHPGPREKSDNPAKLNFQTLRFSRLAPHTLSPNSTSLHIHDRQLHTLTLLVFTPPEYVFTRVSRHLPLRCLRSGVSQPANLKTAVEGHRTQFCVLLQRALCLHLYSASCL